jgi:hypothetical protein
VREIVLGAMAGADNQARGICVRPARQRDIADVRFPKILTRNTFAGNLRFAFGVVRIGI